MRRHVWILICQGKGRIGEKFADMTYGEIHSYARLVGK